MDKDTFVQNVQTYCTLRGVKPTAACRDSGVGTSFINDIKRGQTPSVAKVQQLAAYLGVTTSELLGEPTPVQTQSAALPEDNEIAQLVSLYLSLPASAKKEVLAFMEFKKLK